MKLISKLILYEYERAMWYVSLFIAELEKPLNVFKYVSYAGILIKLFGFNITVMELVWSGLIALVVCWLGGIILVSTGIIKFVNDLNNRQNPWNDRINGVDSIKKRDENKGKAKFISAISDRQKFDQADNIEDLLQ